MAAGFAYKSGVLGEWQRVKNFSLQILKHLTLKKLKNLLIVEYELLRKKDKVKGRPYILKVYANNKCNLRCPFCYTGMGKKMWQMGLAAGENPSGEMDLHIFQHVIDELGPYCFQVLLYGYGEPLFHPKIYEMISFAKSKNVGVAVSSNMTVLKPGDADRIVQSGLEHLTVSIDGVTPETYRVYRVGGDYHQVVANVKAVIEAKRRLKSRLPVIEWQYIVNRSNEHEMDEARRLAAEWGVDLIRFRPLFVYGEDEATFREWMPKDESLSLYDYRTRRMKKQDGSCAWLYRVGVISWDGSIAPCCYYNDEPESYFGLMNESKSFAESWNNENFVFSRALSRDGRKKTTDLVNELTKKNVCRKCDIVHIKN